MLEFYRQVVYDHFDHFNEHYPQLDLDDYALSVEYVTAQEASESIRYFHNQPMTEPASWPSALRQHIRKNPPSLQSDRGDRRSLAWCDGLAVGSCIDLGIRVLWAIR